MSFRTIHDDYLDPDRWLSDDADYYPNINRDWFHHWEAHYDTPEDNWLSWLFAAEYACMIKS